MATALAIALSLWGLYAAAGVVTAHKLRVVHVGLFLPLAFLLYPAHPRLRRLNAVDLGLAVLSLASMAYVVADFDAFVYRSVDPNRADLVFGIAAIALVLEAGRRTAGWMLPALAASALAYASWGSRLPPPWTHRGYGVGRLVGLEYMGLEGIFGTPIAVSATFIVLFTVWGAVLDASGASRFFVELSFATFGRRRSGAGRTVTAASFLLGGPSGSGVATSVALGSVAYPLLKRAGYDREHAGAILAAGGIGAVLSPPVMGAASFLIAEITGVSYLEVIRWALVPALLYYLSVLLMIEQDAARAPLRELEPAARPAAELVRRYGFHIVSLLAIVVLLALGHSAEWSAFWCIVLALLLSRIRRDTAVGPRRFARCLEQSAHAVVPIAATCATAGILVGVVNLTGLGLKFSGILIDLAGGQLAPTAVYAALVLLLLGLALPITASYLVAAAVVAPALIQLGVAQPAAHMFVFYYALLSEVTPPTALSCMAVSALTGGDPYRTMWITWRYALPAFVVPFVLLMPGGMRLLLVGPWLPTLIAVASALLGVAALASGVGGFLTGRAGPPVRIASVAAGLLLLQPAATGDLAGLALFAAALAWQRTRDKRVRSDG